MILRYEHGDLSEQRSYREALSLVNAEAPVISIIGAGGKTTTALHLAQEYVQAQIPVAVTTSTHMQVWEEPWFLLEESMEQFHQILEQEGQVWFGLPTVRKTNKEEDGERTIEIAGSAEYVGQSAGRWKPAGEIYKMQAVSESFYRQVYELHIPLIIEADGARNLPCKAPGELEPVLYRETTDVLAVYGLDAVGRRIKEVCFRPERVSKILHKNEEECLTPEDIAALALSEQGGRKNVLSTQRYCVILNKADTEERICTAKRICETIKEKEDVMVLITSSRKSVRGIE